MLNPWANMSVLPAVMCGAMSVLYRSLWMGECARLNGRLGARSDARLGARSDARSDARLSVERARLDAWFSSMLYPHHVGPRGDGGLQAQLPAGQRHRHRAGARYFDFA